MSGETLYVKKGRRYVPWGNTDSWYREGSDVMRAGQFRLTHCVGDGSTRYCYDVEPNTAAFSAAAMIALSAMEEEMFRRARAIPNCTNTYTKKQQEIIEKFRDEMAAAGGLLPTYWTNSSARDIATAGIKAVENYPNIND